MKKLLFLFFNTISIIGYTQSTRTSTITVTTNNTQVPNGDDRLIKFDGYINSDGYGMGTTLMGVMDTRVYDVFGTMKGAPNAAEWNKTHPANGTYPFIPKSPIVLGVKHTATINTYTTYHVNALSKDYIAYKLTDKDSVVALAMGINAGNVKDYRFHVTENDSTELVPWAVPKLQQLYGAKKPYGFFGKFHAPGKEIIIEVVNTKNYNIRDGVIFNWRNHLKPVISKIRLFARPGWKTQMITIAPNQNNIYAKTFDKITGAPLDFHFPVDDYINTSLNICFKNHPTIGYDVYMVDNHGIKQTYCIALNVRDSVFGVTSQHFGRPGKYELLIYPTGTKNKNQETKIAFEVMGTPTGLKFTIFQILPFAVLIVLVFIIYYLYNKRRIKKLDRQKEMANLKLGSVRAQLNPHFMFNALTSIQNLMNQKDSDGANHYLAKFADLTRQVLNATGQELISLEDELKIINDHLEIEQLRFGFKYTVDVDKSINIANTVVPGMLMQPFIENAAKHGISGMLDKGKIDILITKKQNDLVMIITDNGKGFDTQHIITTGFGLKLGRERIALLNQLYKDQAIELKINSGANGTTITITLTGWL